MKKIIIYMWFALGGIFYGCSDLVNVTPEDSTTFTNYFKSTKDLEALQNHLMYLVVSKIGGSRDQLDIVGSLMDTINSTYQSWLLGPAREMGKNTIAWSTHYSVISHADLIIDNAHRVPAAEEDIRPYVLQACFVKALMYYDLAIRWGEVPIRLNSQMYDKVGKSSKSEVLDYALNYALKAMELPIYEDLRDNNGNARTTKQYASKGAAAALVANIYAWYAAIEGKSEYWAAAEKYCDSIIDGNVGVYSLVETPEAVCRNVLKGNSSETIWEVYRTVEEFNLPYPYWEIEYFVGFPVRSESLKTPTSIYPAELFRSTVRQMYDKEDRRRTAYFWGVDADSIFMVYRRDLNKIQPVAREWDGRKYAYITYNSEENGPEEPRDFLLEAGDTINSGYDVLHDKYLKKAFVTKFRYPYYTTSDYSLEPEFKMMEGYCVYWRLADIILLRAECRARQGKASAADDLNVIRRRAYGDDSHAYPCSSDVEKGLDKDIRLAIFREREKELLFENKRYFDVVRNGYDGSGYDYVRRELPSAWASLTVQDIIDGALFNAVTQGAMNNNDLIRQNIFWEKIDQ